MSRVTLSRYLIEQTRSHNTPADLRFLIEVVARACKEISHAVSKGALGGVLGSMGTEKQIWPNPRGSWLPLWYWLSSLSLPQLWVSSRTDWRPKV